MASFIKTKYEVQNESTESYLDRTADETYDSQESYDTDLEDLEEIIAEPNTGDSVHEKTLGEVYKATCKRFGTIPVSKFLRQCETSVIDLKHYGIGDKGARAVAMALKKCGTITALNLHDNGIGEVGTVDICQMMTENISITQLNLSGNRVGKRGTLFIGKMVSENVYLQNLNLSGCGLVGKHMEALFTAIKFNVSIESLNLMYNDLADQGASYVGVALCFNRTLRFLDISWNDIKDAGARAISEGLSANSKLEELDLSWNGLGDRGAEHMDHALSTNQTLKILNMCNDCIGENGVKSIAKGLKRNQTLEVLKIGRNPILATGVCLLLKTVQRNEKSKLRELHFDQIVFDQECDKALTALLEDNPEFYCTWDVSIKGGPVNTGKRPELIDVFYSYASSQGLRLIDLFKILTNNYNDLLLRKEDFLRGLRKRNFPFSDKQLKDLFDILDADKNGHIDFQEFSAMKMSRRRAGARMALGRAVITMFAKMKFDKTY